MNALVSFTLVTLMACSVFIKAYAFNSAIAVDTEWFRVLNTSGAFISWSKDPLIACESYKTYQRALRPDNCAWSDVTFTDFDNVCRFNSYLGCTSTFYQYSYRLQNGWCPVGYIKESNDSCSLSTAATEKKAMKMLGRKSVCDLSLQVGEDN